MKRRLRKKLHLAEFRQFGFEVVVLLAGKDVTENAANRFLDEFISEALERNHLSCAGGGGPERWHFVIQPDDRYGGTNADRDGVAYWLARQPEVERDRKGAELNEQLEVEHGGHAA